MTTVLDDPKLATLLDELHAKSIAQEADTEDYFSRRRTGPWRGMEPRDHEHFADKLVALDRDKCELCYLLCRAIGARRIVEVGTSFGVSTIYLAAAVRDNGGGIVFGGEHEAAKVEAAKANFDKAGLSRFIDLRHGDIVEVLKSVTGPIDFVLFDVWIDVVRPVLELVLPHLRPGAVICTDNTAGERSRRNYAPFFDVIENPANGFRTRTLPFKGGFELTVKL